MRGLRPAPVIRAAIAIAMVAAGRAGLRAQPPAAASRFASVSGLVDDSLRRGPLANATVMAVGTRRSAVTNARGMFVIDSLEPGEVRIGVRHPLLDTLGLLILSAPMTLAAGQRLDISVTTPTLASVHERLCARGGVATGPAMLVGRVLEADTDAPIAGPAVSLVYKDTSTGDARDHVRQARARDDGTFAICGLPESITGTLQASKGGLSTAELPVTLKNDLLGTAILTFSASSESVAVLEGRITNKVGDPVEGAQVSVAGTPTLGLTRADGTFSLTGLPSGTHEAVVRKIGYAPASRVVALTKRQPRRITVVLSSAQVLAAVRVEGKLDGGLQTSGFNNRKKFGMGHFITPEDITRRRPDLFTDLLETVPGFRIATAAGGRIVQSTRATGGTADGCVNVFIDRSPFQMMQAGDLDMMLHTADVGAVEAYASANDTPAEFQVPGKSCATLVVWTRTRLGRP
jgi:hypothetical protein